MDTCNADVSTFKTLSDFVLTFRNTDYTQLYTVWVYEQVHRCIETGGTELKNTIWLVLTPETKLFTNT